VLQDAGLLGQTRHGRQRVYAVDNQRLALLRDWLSFFDRAP